MLYQRYGCLENRLASQGQELLDDDDEDHLALRIMIGNSRMENDFREKRGLGGSRPGKRANIGKGREDGHKKIPRDCFGKDPVFRLEMFRYWYQMQYFLFLKIMHEVCAYGS